MAVHRSSLFLQEIVCPVSAFVCLYSRTKDLSRQSSLKETKLLMTTHLKRTASIFMFDKHFEFIREIGRGSYSTVSCTASGPIFVSVVCILRMLFLKETRSHGFFCLSRSTKRGTEGAGRFVLSR